MNAMHPNRDPLLKGPQRPFAPRLWRSSLGALSLIICLGQALAVPRSTSATNATPPRANELNEIPIDAPARSFREAKIEPAYKTSDVYLYAKGQTFHRWVYNPWVSLDVNPQSVSMKLSEASGKDMGFASFDLRLPVAHLQDQVQYQLKPDLKYTCDAKSESKPKSHAEELSIRSTSTSTPTTTGEAATTLAACQFHVVVRCYGYVNAKWTKVLDVTRGQTVSGGQGLLHFDPVVVDRSRCEQGITLNVNAHMHQQIRELRIEDFKLQLSAMPSSPHAI